mmetsp:Transcript_15056/g.30059  ORF Transcript_15056/g.30059 Transcript_15056/m.30059 type:complete len:216 (+) Transcript_15056:998-1645(+)
MRQEGKRRVRVLYLLVGTPSQISDDWTHEPQNGVTVKLQLRHIFSQPGAPVDPPTERHERRRTRNSPAPCYGGIVSRQTVPHFQPDGSYGGSVPRKKITGIERPPRWERGGGVPVYWRSAIRSGEDETEVARSGGVRGADSVSSTQVRLGVRDESEGGAKIGGGDPGVSTHEFNVVEGDGVETIGFGNGVECGFYASLWNEREGGREWEYPEKEE